MIQNAEELRISRRELQRLRAALDAPPQHAPEYDWVHRLETEAIRTEIDRIEADIEHYRHRTDPSPRQLHLSSDVGIWEQNLWRALPLKEIADRGWFNLTPRRNPELTVKTYFHRTVGLPQAAALHRRQRLRGTQPNPYALLAWQAQALHQARERAQNAKLPPFLASDKEWLKDLVALTRADDGPSRSVGLLAEHGVVLVTLRHLRETYLDGAAMLDAEGTPVIGLTLRIDRLDNFWFVLFHELGHVFLHLAEGQERSFFDNDEAAPEDELEREADIFALENLTPNAAWEQCFSRFATTESTVRTDAERLGVGVSVLAGRIRRELNDYTLLSGLIGQNEVRCQFTDEDA